MRNTAAFKKGNQITLAKSDELPGPGQYNPALPKGYDTPSSLFTNPDKKFTLLKVDTPAVGSYEVQNNSAALNKAPNVAKPCFINTRNQKKVMQNPYEPFRPQQNIHIGPTHYDVFFQDKIRQSEKFSTPSSFFLNKNVDRFGRSRAVQIAKLETPGPGAYEQNTSELRKLKASVPFDSSAGKQLKMKRSMPGPSYYVNVDKLGRKDFHMNVSDTWL